MSINYTKEQEKAFNTIDDDLQIIACAGSGKTEVISKRIINILKSGKGKPENIIAFTYTEKAAGELKNRIYELVKSELPELKGMAEMYVGTIHGWCFKILQEHDYEYQKFSVLDEIRLKLFVDKNYKIIGMKDIHKLDKPEIPMKMFVDTDRFIQIMNIVSEARVKEGYDIPANIKEAREKYERTLKQNGYLDFSMIMSEAKRLLSQKEGFFRKVCDKIKYLTVDEYQDVNPIQEDIVRLIYESNVNICVVGDDDQNIYQWRGSDVDYIIDFKNRYNNKNSEIESVKLIENFRSSEGIVDLAHNVISRNKIRLDKKMISSSHHDYERNNILYNDFETEEDENAFIAKTIQTLRGKAFKDKPNEDKRGLDYSDFAILIRKWSKAEEITKVLDSSNIPYITGGVNKLFDSKEIKASLGIFEYLSKEIDKNDLINLWVDLEESKIELAKLNYAIEQLEKQDPEREIKKKNGELRPVMYWEFCLQEIFWNFLEDADIREESFATSTEKHDNTFGEIIMYNLGKFSQVINDFESINYKSGSSSFYLFNFLNFIRHAARDYYPEGWINSTYKTPNAVQIITIHQSKGLEFPVVFIPGMNRNYFPAKRKGGLSEWHFLDADIIENADKYKGIDNNFESERRLFYVAITRAKKYLFINRAPALTNRLYQKPSLFINEIGSSDYLMQSISEDFNELDNLEPKSKDSTNNIELNFSILKEFFDCSYRFKLISIYGFAAALNPRMGFGKTIHDSLSEIHKRAYALEDISKEDANDIVSNHENFPYAPPELKEQMQKAAREVVEKYIDENGSEFDEIEFVEKDIQLNLGDGIFVSGRIDLIKRKDFKGNMETTIIEFKSNNEAQDKNITEEQLHLYALGHRELTGEKADYIRIYILQDKENKGESNKGIPKKLNDNHLIAIEKKIRNVVTDIRGKNFERISQYSICKECNQKSLCSGYSKSKLN